MISKDNCFLIHLKPFCVDGVTASCHIVFKSLSLSCSFKELISSVHCVCHSPPTLSVVQISLTRNSSIPCLWSGVAFKGRMYQTFPFLQNLASPFDTLTFLLALPPSLPVRCQSVSLGLIWTPSGRVCPGGVWLDF